ncbi:MAG: DUF2235 domain-containing protein [Smithella sp.]
MSKNIVICSDGTGNSAIKGRGTNVFKLFEAIDLNGHRTNPELVPQVAFYDDGVGTENFKPVKIFAGATGFGLSRNVKQLYKELVRIYEPGDRIFLFGFSRGAFTVRTLADLIDKCGILEAKKLTTADELEKMVRKVYGVYRKYYRTAFMELFLGKPDQSVTQQFKDSYCHRFNVTIAFIGVWDTVDAVGIPFHLGDFINLVFYRFKFPDYYLSKSVEHACHALAIDDERHSFHPLLWNQDKGDDERIEQVWFVGAHSNVGGGYPKHGISLVALDWMLQKAGNLQLRILASDKKLYREHMNVDDKIYDPRAGLGIFYRWKPRDIAAMCHENNVKPVIHLSVLERIAHGTEDYTPGNLPPNARVAITPTGDAGEDAAALERAQAVESVLKAAHTDGRPLLSHVKTEIVIGRISYYLYLLACTAAVLAASIPEGEDALANPLLLIKNAGLFIIHLATLQFAAIFAGLKRLAMSPEILGFLGSAFLVAYLLALFTDRRLSKVFSHFWHVVQPKLLLALKRARKSGIKLEP